APDTRLVAAIVVALLVAVVLILTVPSLRARFVPGLRNGLKSVAAVARIRSKRLELFGGQIAAQLLFALTLGAVCRAYGIELNLAGLLLVNPAASAFAGGIPPPGGVGAAEGGATGGGWGVGGGRGAAPRASVSAPPVS